MIKRFFIGLLFFVPFYTQAQLVDSVSKALTNYVNQYPQEKMYVHLDRSGYSPGDTVWFKVYLLDAQNHSSDSISKNIYVDFFNKKSGRLLGRQFLKNEGGWSYSNFTFPDSISEGVYEIRAYTNWMRNFPEDLFFNKEIYVKNRVDQGNQIRFSDHDLTALADLQFFPEGGNLIAGLQNRVAFKAVNRFGQGVDFSAFVVSENRDTVASINSVHLGMGSFIMTPKVGVKYFVQTIDMAAHQPRLFYLPNAVAQGYTFFVDNLSNKESIKISARNNFPFKDTPVVMGQQRGNIIFVFGSEKEGNSFVWNLEKADIPSDGIVQFSLFSGSKVPQCERLIYNNTNTSSTAILTSDKKEYSTREPVSLNIQVNDDEGNPVQGNFSLSVTDMSQDKTEIYSENIENYFLLSSEVKSLANDVRGYIEQPGYYFDRANIDASVHLDILLMTQGWRRFVLRDVLVKDSPEAPFAIETGGITLSGNARLATGKVSSKPIDVSLFYKIDSANTYFNKAKTDEHGRFKFNDLQLSKKTQVLLQGRTSKNTNNVEIQVDKFEFPTYKNNPSTFDPLLLAQAKVSLEEQEKLVKYEAQLRSSKTKILKEVVVKAKREHTTDKRKVFYEGMSIQTVTMPSDNCGFYSSIFQYLVGRVAGFGWTPTEGDYSPYLLKATSFTGKTTPKILVDGVVMDWSYAKTLSPCIIESVEVVSTPVSMLNALGVISILTKNGNPKYDWLNDKTPGNAVIVMEGYHQPREFYSPKYSSADNDKNLIDIRPTLYWNPKIKTDEKGNAKVTFWNSDNQTNVKVNLQGVAKDGQPIYSTLSYTVN
jgi:hypothetical protein